MTANRSVSYINHVALVLDWSGSMDGLKHQVVKVADNIVKHLATRSQELDQETRATVYGFGSTIECLYYDKDTLRLPSIVDKYKIEGMTKLCAATHKSIDDLEKTATLYGDHSFLIYVVTDGGENDSSRTLRASLPARLNNLPNNWTMAVLVPNAQGVHECKGFGFPAGNIAVWNTTEQGIQEVGLKIQEATDTYMQNRALGVRGTRSLFENVKVEKLVKPTTDKFIILNTPPLVMEIRPFVESKLGFYQLGSAYYQLTKTETVQPQKKVAIFDKQTGDVYTGTDARDMLGLPPYSTKLAPESHPKFELFVQSTSVNRKLMPNTKVLVMNA